MATASVVDWRDSERAVETLPIAELKRSGVVLAPHEAVAIIQKLIHDRAAAAASPPFGPPSLANVELGADGSVVCRACEITPAIAEVAILLQALLPIGAPLPGGLRYAIARALHEVDVPPFDSLGEFSDALSRYERGDRSAVVRRLLRRTSLGSSHLRDCAVDRRHPAMSVTDVRRQLRDADRQLYERRLSPSAEPMRRRRGESHARPWIAGALACATAIAASAVLLMAGTFGQSHQAAPAPRRSAVRTDIELPPAAAPLRPQPSSIRKHREATVHRAFPVRSTPRRGHSVPLFPGVRLKLVDDFAARTR